MKTFTTRLFVASILLAAGTATAGSNPATVVIPMALVDANGIGNAVGTVVATDTRYGLLLSPGLSGLEPGLHGFHVHENPSCAPAEKDGRMTAGQGAGGHYDPAKTGRHEGPYGEGHLGDLPALYVAPDRTASNPVLAPRLKVADLAGRSLMLHAGGDNHADHPMPLGGGGARMACGVVPAAK